MISWGDNLPGAIGKRAFSAGIAARRAASRSTVLRRSSATSFIEPSGTDPKVLLVVTFYGVVDDIHSDFTLLPANNLDAPALEILVDVKEVLDFFQIML